MALSLQTMHVSSSGRTRAKHILFSLYLPLRFAALCFVIFNFKQNKNAILFTVQMTTHWYQRTNRLKLNYLAFVRENLYQKCASCANGAQDEETKTSQCHSSLWYSVHPWKTTYYIVVRASVNWTRCKSIGNETLCTCCTVPQTHSSKLQARLYVTRMHVVSNFLS